MDLPPKAPARRRSRWRHLPFVVAAFAALALIWIWFFYDAQRQDKWIRTAALVLAAYVGFLVWVLFGSRWRARNRWSVFVGTILAILFCRLALRVTGVTGDMLPIVDWRWNRSSSVTKRPSPTSASPATARLTNSYPQFLGPERNGVLPGPQFARDWKQTPPRELWRCAVGAAWSGFAVEDHRAITQEQRGDEELVTCYDVLTGAPLWTHADTARYATTMAGEGPRATPTIDGARVFTMGGTGMLNCLDVASGKVVWSTNTIAGHNAKVPDWGVACSPLVTSNAVIVTVGGHRSTLVAYHKLTGAKLWAAGDDDVHWSSPVRAAFGASSQIITFNYGVAGHDEHTGKVLWQSSWRGGYPRVATPLVLSSNRVLVSSGYGVGAELLQINRQKERWQAAQVWKSIRLKSKFANLIHLDGFIYGLDDGALVCVDVNDGALKWKGDRYGHGQMILAGRLLLLTAEKGDVVLLEPAPEEQRELARFKVFSAKTWNPPALAGDLLLVRNDREAACLQLPLRR